ncbi:hypothetical protein ACFL5F_01560 [Planctomycetota bacterium]
MEKQKKSAMIKFPVMLLAVSAILLCASPCSAMDIYGTVTIPSEQYPDPSYDKVVVKFGGTLNLLVGGVIDGSVNVEEGGKLNLEGGYIRDDMFAYNLSEVKITGGSVGGWVNVDPFANVTVFGTDFAVANGTIDPSGTYFTPDTWPPCLLTVTYGGVAGTIELEFFVYDPDVHIFLAAPATEVIFDIKPGSDQNSINRKSKGVVPVAVFSTYNFDAGTINPASVLFAGASPVKWKLEDVDDDGDDDMMFHFRTQELDLDPSSTEATLEAELLTGVMVSWTDEVRIVPSKKSKKK